MFQDFGLDVEAFRQMVGDCPPHFFNLTVICCSVRPLMYCYDKSYIILPCESHLHALTAGLCLVEQ